MSKIRAKRGVGKKLGIYECACGWFNAESIYGHEIYELLLLLMVVVVAVLAQW